MSVVEEVRVDEIVDKSMTNKMFDYQDFKIFNSPLQKLTPPISLAVKSRINGM